MSLSVHSELPSPILLFEIDTPPGVEPRVSLAESPTTWAIQQLHARVFAPLLRSQTPAGLQKKVGRARAAYEEIMTMVAPLIGAPTDTAVAKATESRRRRFEEEAATWGRTAFAYLKKAHEIRSLTFAMEVRTAKAQPGGVIIMPPYQRARFFAAMAELEMLSLTADAAPAYARAPAPILKLPSAVGDRLAYLTWEATMRFHAHVLAFARPEVREQVLSSLEAPTDGGAARINRLLQRVPAALAARYRRLVSSPPPSEEEVDEAVRQACDPARSAAG